MINGNFFLNYQNAYDYFGVLVADGGYKGFFSPPRLKSIASNDWPEEDGIEPDLGAPAFEGRTFDVDFLCVDPAKMDAFFNNLIAPGYHLFELSELGVSFVLRYTGQKKTKRFKAGEVFSLSFAEDEPLADYIYGAPAPVSYTTQSYAIDGTNLSTGYGVLVGGNTDDEFRKRADAKSNLSVSTKNSDGIIYDTGIMKLKSRDANATMLFRVPTTAVFWQNYRAFLYDLKRPGERTFSGPFGAHSCFYRSGDIKRFEKLAGGGVWCELKMKFTIL